MKKKRNVVSWLEIAQELITSENWGRVSNKSVSKFIGDGSDNDLKIALLLDIAKSLRKLSYRQ